MAVLIAKQILSFWISKGIIGINMMEAIIESKQILNFQVHYLQHYN